MLKIKHTVRVSILGTVFATICINMLDSIGSRHPKMDRFCDLSRTQLLEWDGVEAVWTTGDNDEAIGPPK